MPTLRTTALVDACAPTVLAAFTEPATIASALAPWKMVVRASVDQLALGEELLIQRRCFVGALRIRLLTADPSELVAVPVGGPLPELCCAVTFVETGAGTLVTCSLDWRSPGGPIGRLLDVLVGRRFALRIMAALVAGVCRRAMELAASRVVVGAVIVSGDRVLAAQRAHPAKHVGRWEFPGGQVLPGESEVDAVRRECCEELAVGIEVGRRIGPDLVLADHLVLRVYAARMPGEAKPVAVEHQSLRWVNAADLAGLDWLPADRLLLGQVAALLTNPR